MENKNMAREEMNLLECATNKFKVLTEDERELITGIQKDDTCDDKAPENNEAIKNITIRAKVIAWFLKTPEATKLFTHNGFTIENAIITDKLDLQGLKINFSLCFEKCTFDKGIDLSLSHIGSLAIYRSTVKGEINLINAQIDGQLNCSGSSFNNPDKDAFTAQNTIINGSVFFNKTDDKEEAKDFETNGKVDIIGIKIRGALCCGGGKFRNKKNKKAFNLENALIDDDVLLNEGFEAEGEVNFQGAIINGSLDCSSGEFNNQDGRAINCKRIIVKKDVFFTKSDEKGKPFRASGEVKLCGGQIEGELKCCGGIFHNPSVNTENDPPKYALIGKGLIVDGAVLFNDKFEAIGEVNLYNAKINGPLVLKDVIENDHYKLVLKNAFIHMIDDNNNSWPKKGNLDLDNLIYNNIEYDTKHPKDRVKWLKLNSGKYNPQPYRQLASVLDNKGYENEARDIRIAMNDELLKRSQKKWQKFWLTITGSLIGYGYKPFKVWKIALFFWILGALLYYIGDKSGVMQPPSKSAYTNDQETTLYDHYPKFNALFYSLDVFLPILNLHQEDYWQPNTLGEKNKITGESTYNPWGWLLIGWMYLQILAGWVLTTMLLGGLSGLIRNK
jgi:hypothetical protein